MQGLLVTLSSLRLHQSLPEKLNVIASSTHGSVSLESLHLVCDGAEGNGGFSGGGSDNITLDLLGLGELFLGRITSLGLVALSGEHNQTRLVLLQTLDIELQRFHRLVGSSVVNSNTDGLSKLGGNTSFLELLKSKATSSADFAAVLLSRTVYKRSKRTRCRTRCKTCCLQFPSFTTDLLLNRLLKPCLHTLIPVLMEMLVGYDVVVPHILS
mmetsp:Transcript_26497/g.39354  ORF Transcript_26497/g.39354 Transcript_26497/m.39354 type:complete len:212 (+) Transcript_26497:81-716(+)